MRRILARVARVTAGPRNQPVADAVPPRRVFMFGAGGSSRRRTTMSLWRRSIAEMCGTLWLVLGGCGSAVLAAAFPGLGIGFAGVALAFGLTIVSMAYALGPISGAHFNPAVSVGLWIGGRFPGREVPIYI